MMMMMMIISISLCLDLVVASQTRNKHIQISVPGVGYEPVALGLEGTETVDGLEREKTMISNFLNRPTNDSPVLKH
jgi:hypothetical protein